MSTTTHTTHATPKPATTNHTASHATTTHATGTHSTPSHSSTTHAPAHKPQTTTHTTHSAAKPASTSHSTASKVTAIRKPAAKKAKRSAKSTADKTARTAKRTGKTASRNTRTAANATSGNTRSGSENVVRMGNATREMANAGTDAINKASRFSKAGMENFSEQAGNASRKMNEMASKAQGHMDAFMQSGNMAADMSKKLSEEIYNYANETFSNNVEISKDVFACRTINDVFDLQNKLFKANMDRFFTESSKISEMMFNYVNKASEPLNESMQGMSGRATRSGRRGA